MNKRISNAIEYFEQMVREDAWKGGGHPNDIPSIEVEYKKAKQALNQIITDEMNKKYQARYQNCSSGYEWS